MDEPHTDLCDELFEIATSVRALVGWYESTGAWGFPHGPPAPPREEPSIPEYSARPQAPEPRAYAPAPPSYEERPEPRAASFTAPQPRPPSQQAQPRRAEVLGPEARVERLRVLENEVAACRRCGLCETRTQTVFARGNPMAELCFVGEGPGAEEDQTGLPFVGAAGQLLDKMIGAMGYRPDEVYICNIVKCRPPQNRKPQPEEMSACKSYLTTQLDLVRPKYIVALGTTATQGLLGTAVGIMRLRGQWKLYRGIPVMPTYHPAYLLRQPTAKREVWADLQEVMARLGKKPPARG